MIDVRVGDTCVFRRTEARSSARGKVEKASRVNLHLVADYWLGAEGTGERIDVRFKLPRVGVDEVWRDGVKVFDSGREAAGYSR